MPHASPPVIPSQQHAIAPADDTMANNAFDFDVDALIEENQADMPAREREGRRRRRIDDSDSERSVSPARSHHTHSEEDSGDASGDEDDNTVRLGSLLRVFTRGLYLGSLLRVFTPGLYSGSLLWSLPPPVHRNTCPSLHKSSSAKRWDSVSFLAAPTDSSRFQTSHINLLASSWHILFRVVC